MMSSEQCASMEVIYEAIRDGADAFLVAEYKICFLFVGCFSVVIYGLIGVLQEVRRAATRNPPRSAAAAAVAPAPAPTAPCPHPTPPYPTHPTHPTARTTRAGLPPWSPSSSARSPPCSRAGSA